MRSRLTPTARLDLPPFSRPAQTDPKFLRNQRFAKKYNGKGRNAE
jgi:hypothetical protein